jgi:tetratricopeptide (TPR) repeat protein
MMLAKRLLLWRIVMFVTRLMALVIVLLTLGPLQAMASRKALVIGNDEYPGNQLKNAVNDATSVAVGLKSMGYSTTLVTNVPRRAMESAISTFAGALNRGDTAVFYYAGHGLQVSGENYLVPTDFKVAGPADVKYQGYSLSSLLNEFTAHGATTEIVILDACRNNPFRGTRSLQEGWAGVATSAGTLIAFGTSPGSTASDDPNSSHGLFTQELLKYLTSSQLSAEAMLQQVRQDVIRASEGNQVPWTASSLTGSFHFRPGLDAAMTPLPALSLSTDNGTTGNQGRSVGTPVTSGSNHFTASSIYAQQPSSTSSNTDPRDYDPLLARAATLAQQGDYNSSVRTLKAVLELDPRSALALRILGLVFNLMGQHGKSVAALTRAVEIDPQNAKSYYYLCLVRGRSDASDAVEDCEASLGIDPNNPNSHLGLANALLALGDLDRARAEAQQAIQMDPNSSLGYSVLGKILAKHGDMTGAQENYSRAIAMNQDNKAPGSDLN